jgi:hypothetical protein
MTERNIKMGILLWCKVPSQKPKTASINLAVFNFVLEEGLEPSSLAACDFESHVYTIPPLQQLFYCIANYQCNQ